MIDATLAGQLAALRALATPATVPGAMFAWWGSTEFPDGSSSTRALSQPEWEATYSRLHDAALIPGAMPPLYALQAMTNAFRADGPVPIAIASFRVTVPQPAFAARVVAAANAGAVLDPAPTSLAPVTTDARVFMAAGMLHAQWTLATPMVRSRAVTFVLDERFFVTNVGAPNPDAISVDAGDGRGFRRIDFGDSLIAIYPSGDTATVTVRATYADAELTARFSIGIGGAACAPPPDETWPLWGPPNNAGTAYVWRAHGQAAVTKPVILAEGFPGGYPYDYLYDIINQAGTLEKLRTAGLDVIIVGFSNGTDLLQNNASVIRACIAQAMQRTKEPLVVGGVSMGAIVSRFALAQMESRGLPHNARIYLSIDGPHRGSVTSLAMQWFAQFFRDAMPGAAAFAALLNTPANQQFVMRWLNGGTADESPLRTRLLQQFRDIGDYPQLPLRLAVSCGRGDGARSLGARAPAVEWAGSPFVSATLWTSPDRAGSPAPVADGYSLRAAPGTPATLSISSDVSWEGAPGGTNDYDTTAEEIARTLGCGTVTDLAPCACSVPTVSALDIDQDPFSPIPPPGSTASPFHDYICASDNTPHLTITPEIGAWIVRQLVAPPASP